MHTACGPGAIVGCTQRASVPIRQGEVHPSSGCHGALSRLSSEPILHTDWPFPFSPVDWTQAPPAGQASLAAFHQEIEQRKQRIAVLEARPQATSEPSCRPPSSDAPCRIGRTQRDRTTAGRPGAQLGHPGVHQTWLSPTSTAHLRPTACRGGHRALAGTVPYSTHQVIALPPINLDLTHGLLYQADCPSWGQRVKAPRPPEHPTGYGPRPSALLGAMAGVQGTSRSLRQTCCFSVLGCPLGLGASQPVRDRVTLVLPPP